MSAFNKHIRTFLTSPLETAFLHKNINILNSDDLCNLTKNNTIDAVIGTVSDFHEYKATASRTRRHCAVERRRSIHALFSRTKFWIVSCIETRDTMKRWNEKLQRSLSLRKKETTRRLLNVQRSTNRSERASTSTGRLGHQWTSRLTFYSVAPVILELSRKSLTERENFARKHLPHKPVHGIAEILG